MRRPLRNSDACEPDTDITALFEIRAMVGVRRISERIDAGVVGIVDGGEQAALDFSAKWRGDIIRHAVPWPAVPVSLGRGAATALGHRCSPFNAMSNYCEPLVQALKDCLLHSDCVLKQNKLPSDCLKNHINELPEQCRQLRQATFECKRGMVRPTRF